MNRGKLENCSRIKDVNGRLALGTNEVKRIWKDYFEDIYVIWILKSRLQSTCVALMVFRGVTILEES